MCVIVVSNSGPCIDADILPRLFEPFVTTKPAGKGLGLGLVISAHIVRAFGGSLRARNLAPTRCRVHRSSCRAPLDAGVLQHDQ